MHQMAISLFRVRFVQLRPLKAIMVPLDIRDDNQFEYQILQAFTNYCI